MTHDELLTRIKEGQWVDRQEMMVRSNALRAVVELHRPITDRMPFCSECVTIHQGETDVVYYPCPTIQAIEKELQ